MAAGLLDVDGAPGELFWLAPDSELKQVVDTALDLVRRSPAILTRIEEDQDVLGLAKKQQRQIDARWQASFTDLFPGLTLPEPPEPETRGLPLELGRPRMPAEVVYVFFVLQGYLGSISDRRAREQLQESRTLDVYLQSRGLHLPGWTTILENVNAICVETRSFILDAQLAMILEDELDDFSAAMVDSTACKANSAWPTDGRMILGLLRRAFRASQKLEDFGLLNVPKHWVPTWLKKIQRLVFHINTASGKPHASRKRKKHYRELLGEAEKILDYLLAECQERDPVAEVSGLPPSRQQLLARLWAGLEDDLINACEVCNYSSERIFEGLQRPAKEKLLSLGDASAAYIEKGAREAVIGYKPQVARSGNGFVTAMIVAEGNDADSTQLSPMVEQIQQRTGVLPRDVTADDGYAVEALREQLLAGGVEKVYLCGAKAKAFIPEEEWEDPDFQQARRGRSAVESFIFVLKFLFGFGRLRRRGLEAVQAELLEKAIAYNFYRVVLLRSQAQAAARKAA